MSNPDHDQRLLTLVGCIRGIVLEFDGAVRYLNAWADDPALLAAPREAMIGKTIDEVLGSEAGAPFTAMVHRVFATGEIEHLEYPLDIDGCRRWFFADIKRVGTPPTVVFFARDITERRATEERLARSEERYRLAAQATNDVLWDWDLATDEMTWNSAIQSLLGYDQETTSATWRNDRLHPDDRAQALSSLGVALAGDASAWSARYRFRRADGSYGSFLDRGFITRDGTGRPMRMVGSMTDVTQVDRLQAQLLHADRMAALGTLAAGVGHEINNPLSFVIGNLDVVLATLGSDHELQEPLCEARDGARHIAEIVKSLRMFTRADDSEVGAVNVHDVLDAAVKMADHEIRRRARLVRDYGSSLPSVRANDAQLGQVFLNILINAAQAIGESDPDRNEIRLSTAVDARHRVTVTIRDTGCGIPPEQLARVFDPFFTTKPVG
ncbi:MAG: PAS domain-containing protein, partial [Deltaproteobacteria bacterium]|nr:PAS domain-containing protein [Deltaproteobacteria bacterium]